MSRILLQKDNITISGEIHWAWIEPDWTGIKTYFLKLTFILLVNWKQKVWWTNYELEQYIRNLDRTKYYWLKSYYAWNDIKDFLQTLWYDLEDCNINNWIEQFQID